MVFCVMLQCVVVTSRHLLATACRAVAVAVFTTVAVAAARSARGHVAARCARQSSGFPAPTALPPHGRGIMIGAKGQKDVDYDTPFRLYLQTRLSRSTSPRSLRRRRS